MPIPSWRMFEPQTTFRADSRTLETVGRSKAMSTLITTIETMMSIMVKPVRPPTVERMCLFHWDECVILFNRDPILLPRMHAQDMLWLFLSEWRTHQDQPVFHTRTPLLHRCSDPTHH